MCVTRFDQSECVICRVYFRARKEPFSKVYVVKFSLYSKVVLVISTLYRRGKFLEHFILIADILSVCDKFELLGHVQAAMMI